MIWTKCDEPSIAVTVSNADNLLSDIRQRLSERRGFSVATLNLDHVAKFPQDAAFRQAYGEHTHVTADGNPIVWLSRLAGQEVSLVPGSELVEPVASIASEVKKPVCLVGATEASLKAAADALVERCPNLNVAMIYAPAMGFDPDGAEATDIVDRIEKSGARVAFLALGAPRQEIFAARAQKLLPEVGFLSIGAGLDFISGAQTRAPRWARVMAVEWAWRLAHNPRRLAARYFACFLILPSLVWRAVGARQT